MPSQVPTACPECSLPILEKDRTAHLQNVHGHALPKLDKAQEKMLGANVIVVKPVGFLASKRQNLLSPGCEIIHCSMAS